MRNGIGCRSKDKKKACTAHQVQQQICLLLAWTSDSRAAVTGMTQAGQYFAIGEFSALPLLDSLVKQHSLLYRINILNQSVICMYSVV